MAGRSRFEIAGNESSMPSKTKISTYLTELTPQVLLGSIIENLKAFPKFVWQIIIEALLVPGYRDEWGEFQKWRPDAEPRHGTAEDERRDRRKKRRLLKQKASFYHRYDFFSDKYRGHPHDHENCARVKFNVGGRVFETQLRTLGAFPHTLLGDPERRLAFYDSTTQMYYLDRSRGGFEAILYFYQSGGRIRRPDELSVEDFMDELLFYDLGEDVRHDFIMAEGLWEDETTKVLPRNLFQRKIWLLFEYPESSVQSYIVAIMSVMTITASISAFCMETMPMFKENELKRTSNRTGGDDGYGDYDETNLLDIFNLVEIICVSWFGLEFLARLLSCPKKIAFITDMMNIVDFIAIVPFFVQASSTHFGNSGDSQTKKGINQAAYLSIIRVIRLVRVFRILKLSRHSTGLQILGLTLQASIRELSLLIFFLMIGVVLFSSAVYFAEQGSSSLFPSIPTSFYWGVVTMTTVGYGDMVPTTPLGKIIGTFTAVAGVLTIALPVPVIVSNFNFFYHRATGKANKKNYSNPDHVRMCPFLPGNGVHPDIAEKVQKVRAKDKFGYDSEISVDDFESPRTSTALEAAGDFKGRRRRRSSVSRRIHEASKRNQESYDPQSGSDSSFSELKFENRKQKKK